MQRRGYLGLVAGFGIAGCVDTARDAIDSATGTHGPKKEFGVGSPGFESAGWTKDGMFEVTFSDDHDMDGYGIRYHAHSEVRDDIVVREAPDFAGTDRIDLLNAFTGYDSRPPSGQYNINAYKGAVSNPGPSFVQEELGSVSFYIKPSLTVRSPEISDNYEFVATVENSGNSPCLIDSVSIRDAETAVDARVNFDETKEILSGEKVFPADEEDSSCMALLEEFTVRINTIPKQDLVVEMQKEYEHERVCKIQF